MTFRLTHKLATKIKAGKPSPLPPAEDPLTDWSGHLFVAGRVHYILLSNTTSLYSAVIYGRGIMDVDGSSRASCSHSGRPSRPTGWGTSTSGTSCPRPAPSSSPGRSIGP